MASDLIGIVYYADDPQKRVFRVVYPSNPAHLDGPALETNPSGGGLRVMRRDDGTHAWHTFCTKPEHHPVFVKIPRADLAKWNDAGALGVVGVEAELSAAKK